MDLVRGQWGWKRELGDIYLFFNGIQRSKSFSFFFGRLGEDRTWHGLMAHSSGGTLGLIWSIPLFCNGKLEACTEAVTPSSQSLGNRSLQLPIQGCPLCGQRPVFHLPVHCFRVLVPASPAAVFEAVYLWLVQDPGLLRWLA